MNNIQKNDNTSTIYENSFSSIESAAHSLSNMQSRCEYCSLYCWCEKHSVGTCYENWLKYLSQEIPYEEGPFWTV